MRTAHRCVATHYGLQPNHGIMRNINAPKETA